MCYHMLYFCAWSLRFTYLWALFSVFLTKAISLSSVKIIFDPFLVIFVLFCEEEEEGLTEVTGPKLSFYKTINNPIELCIFHIVTVSLSANVVSKYMRVPCKVKIHHHGCFWMYGTCSSSRRRVSSRLSTFNSFTQFLRNVLVIYPIYSRLALNSCICKKSHIFTQISR